MTGTVLAQFLRADDLDEANARAAPFESFTPEEQQTIRDVLADWQDQQAIANLLMYPDVMPPDVRRAALRRGLDEPRNYLTLAAVVGLQERADWWSDTERAAVFNRLFMVAVEGRVALAERASLTMSDYARPENVDELLLLLNHPGTVVPRNMLLTLIRLLGTDETRSRLTVPPLDEERRDQLFNLLNSPSVQAGGLLFSYIPNMNAF